MNRVFPQNNEPQQTYKPEVLAALRTFRRAKPWQGTLDERKAKFQDLHTHLCAAYGFEGWTLKLDAIPALEAQHGNGAVRGETKEIELTGKLSVVTYLFGFGAIVTRGNSAKARTWAVNLYKRMFPRSAARMDFIGGFVVKPANLN